MARLDFPPMRFHYHDVRDMPGAIVLACDLRRVVHACRAVLWTATVVLGLLIVLNWRATGEVVLEPDGLQAAKQATLEGPVSLGKLLFWACTLTGWWLGFAYLNAPVLRSAALEIARDERGKLPPEPLLYRMAAAAPLMAMAIPAALVLVVLVLAPLAHIPGAVGAVVLLFVLPLALICAVVAALGFLLFGAAAPMMGPTAVVEGRDYLEALSRPAGFVLQKPFRYAAYMAAKLGVVVTAAIAGALVLGLAWGIVAGCMWLVGAGDLAAQGLEATTNPGPLLLSNEIPPFVIASIFWASVGMLLCWLSAVSQCADLITYLLMRYRIEGTTFDQVMVAEDRLKLFPTAEQTAAEAEEARKRFDAQQAAKPAAEAPKAEPAKAE